jgi:ABC-type glycerol-3-phosphate transport system substrate-binding protein
MVASNPLLSHMKQARIAGLVARPAATAGKAYGEVSQAYFTAVHAILTGGKTPEQALAEAEARIVAATGFKPGPPRPLRDGRREMPR